MDNVKNDKISKKTLYKKIFVYVLPIGITVVVAIYFILFWIIYSPVDAICEDAINEFEGDAVEALLIFIDSDTHSIEEKNHAIWAIGQFGDERALPVLEKYYSGEACQKPCRTDRYICQYGLEKAIKFSKDGGVYTPLIRIVLLN